MDVSAERRLRALLDHAPLVYFVFGLDGIYTAHDGAGLAALGRKPGEYIGRSVFDVYGYHQEIVVKVQRALAGEYVSWVGELRGVWLQLEAVPIKDDQGRVVEVLGLAVDVTAHRRVEQALREAEERLRMVVRAAPIVFTAVDTEGRIMFLDGAGVRRTGLSPEDSVGKSMLDLYADEPLVIEVMRRALAGETGRAEVPVRGGVRLWDTHYSPLRGADGAIVGMVAVGVDVTERRNAELERERLLAAEREARAQAEAALALREEFISIASHELNTPLTSLKLQLQELERMAAAGEVSVDHVRRVAASGHRQVQRLARLVGDMVDAARIRSGQLTVENELVDLGEVVRDVVARLAEDARQAHCTVTCDAGSGVVGTWDRQRLEQVAANLLSNAFKYGRGRPVEVDLAADERHARLVVKDHGIGMEPRVLERLFTPFARGGMERGTAGLGLGLYIARQIVDALGGRIAARSLPGQGAVFTVELPLGGGR